MSLPIPTRHRSTTTYRALGMGELVEKMTKGRIVADDLCHEDPVFQDGRWAFGQTGAAQSHLERNGVGIGDVFLFFGLFASHEGRDRHHRIFGYLEVNEVYLVGQRPSEIDSPVGFDRRHPHTIGEWNRNNTIYVGAGAKAGHAHPFLRLTRPHSLPSVWHIPAWLKGAGLTYHSNPDRWIGDHELRSAARGQEFVANIGDEEEPRRWLRTIQPAVDENHSNSHL